jgi:hypothetical protein
MKCKTIPEIRKLINIHNPKKMWCFSVRQNTCLCNKFSPGSSIKRALGQFLFASAFITRLSEFTLLYNVFTVWGTIWQNHQVKVYRLTL